MDFGPVVKPLGITVKKDVGKVLETSEVVRPQATREFRKVGQEPRSPKRSRKRGGPKNLNFKILKFKTLRFSKVLWRGASVDVGFIAYFGGKMLEQSAA